MFESFFPKPRLFLLTGAIWAALAIAAWYLFVRQAGVHFGFPPAGPSTPPAIGISAVITPPYLWFYFYYLLVSVLFGLFWTFYARHPWTRWSVWGTLAILFVTYFGVQLSVINNNWFGPFWDFVQAAVTKSRPVTSKEFYHYLAIWLGFAAPTVVVDVFNAFFASHYVFRWRVAMNDHFTARWNEVRHIEGASQRIQEDTMRFSTIMETLAVAFINAVMTLIAFVPLLIALTKPVTVLPIIGHVPQGMMAAAVVWSIFGTTVLALLGFKLPGLNFKNQRVEAAYRKELVLGEDDPERAKPETLKELFARVRKNYFTLYFHYIYFNVGFYTYANLDVIYIYWLLSPTILAGLISFGLLNQIAGAYSSVSTSFQYLISSWTTIIELLSIHKRLRAFEATMKGQKLDHIEHQLSPT